MCLHIEQSTYVQKAKFWASEQKPWRTPSLLGFDPPPYDRRQSWWDAQLPKSTVWTENRLLTTFSFARLLTTSFATHWFACTCIELKIVRVSAISVSLLGDTLLARRYSASPLGTSYVGGFYQVAEFVLWSRELTIDTFCFSRVLFSWLSTHFWGKLC
jgi:hypothetical protein